jgi:hypothetical protein
MLSSAALTEKEGIPREVFFRTWMESGMEATAGTRLVGDPPEPQERILERARARYEEVVMACVAPPSKPKVGSDLRLRPARACTFRRLWPLTSVLSMTEAVHGDGTGQEARRRGEAWNSAIGGKPLPRLLGEG